MSARRPPRSRRRRRADPKALLLALAVLGFAALGAALLDRAGPGDMPRAPAEPVQGRIVVVDGDTFRIGGEPIRVENIDTPEMGDGASCASERLLAEQATAHASRLLADESAVAIRRVGEDQYGRTLARVTVNGRDFGQTMIAAGLAQPWRGRRADWCNRR